MLFAKGCETARVIGAEIILDNAPIPPWKFPDGIPVTRHFDEEVIRGVSLPAGLKWDSYWQALVETYREACRVAGSNGLTFHLHPCFGSLVNSADGFLHFAGAVKSDILRFNLDTANQFFMRENRFTFLCDDRERKLLACIARRLNRSQADALRLLVELAGKELKIGLSELACQEDQECERTRTSSTRGMKK